MIEYVDPTNGQPVFKTITFFMQMLRPGERTQPLEAERQPAGGAVRGQGYSLIGGKRLDWEQFDTFAMPGGEWAEHVNTSDREPAILFVASDEPTLKSLALYQKHGRDEERRGGAPLLTPAAIRLPHSRKIIMARSKNTKLLANFDCPGGGQVWVVGTTLYVGHMRQPTGTTIVDVVRPRGIRSRSPTSRCRRAGTRTRCGSPTT